MDHVLKSLRVQIAVRIWIHEVLLYQFVGLTTGATLPGYNDIRLMNNEQFGGMQCQIQELYCKFDNIFWQIYDISSADT